LLVTWEISTPGLVVAQEVDQKNHERSDGVVEILWMTLWVAREIGG
jgi:hypothetical protein